MADDADLDLLVDYSAPDPGSESVNPLEPKRKQKADRPATKRQRRQPPVRKDR